MAIPHFTKSATAQRLTEAREVLGFAAIDVAEHMGIPLADLEAFEAGTKTVPVETLRRFARFYRRDIDWLFGVTPDADVSRELLESVEELSDTDKEAVLKFARFLATNPKTP